MPIVLRTGTAVLVALTTLELTQSADHASLSGYGLNIYSVNWNDPVLSLDLGKPTPVGGVITVDISATLAALPAGTYTAKVLAIGGSGGYTESVASAQFTVT